MRYVHDYAMMGRIFVFVLGLPRRIESERVIKLTTDLGFQERESTVKKTEFCFSGCFGKNLVSKRSRMNSFEKICTFISIIDYRGIVKHPANMIIGTHIP